MLDKQFILRFISYIIILDLLFMPYFPYLVMPFSLPLVLIGLIFFANINKDKEIFLFLIIFITVLISVLISIYLDIPSEYLIDNLKRAFQFLSTFMYFFFFKYIFRELNLNLKPIVILFTLYVTILIGLFVYEPASYLNFRNSVYPFGTSDLGKFTFFSRFDYMFPDPNTAGYFILLVLFFALAKFKFNIFFKIMLLFVSILTVIVTKSVGASLALLIFLGYYVFNFLIKKEKIKTILLVIPLILLICLLVFTSNLNINKKITNGIFENYATRVTMSKTDEGGRVDLYKNVTNEFYPFILGRGYTLVNEGNSIKPHSDHLRLLYSYGLLCYLIVLYMFFRNIFRIKFIFLIPALIAFSVNTLIDEQKLLALFLILLAYSYSENNQKAKRKVGTL